MDDGTSPTTKGYLVGVLLEVSQRLKDIDVNTRSGNHSSIVRNDGRHTKVFIRVGISAIADISTIKQEFTCNVFMAAKWQEPTLADEVNAEEIDWDKKWNPRLYLANAVEVNDVTCRYTLIPGSHPFPTVQMTYRARARLKSTFHLKDFPFDHQTLYVQVSSKWSSKLVSLAESEDFRCTISPLNFTDSAEWVLGEYVMSDASVISPNSCSLKSLPPPEAKGQPNVKDESSLGYSNIAILSPSIETFTFEGMHWPTAQNTSSQTNDLQYSVCEFQFHIQRKHKFYMINIFLLMFIITLLSLGSFAVKVSDAGDRLNICLTLTLTAVAFKFTASTNLPPVSYLTLLDHYIVTSFIYMFAVSLYHFILIKWIIRRVRDIAMIDNLTMKVFFGVLLLIQVVFFVHSLLIQRRVKKLFAKCKREYLNKHCAQGTITGTLKASILRPKTVHAQKNSLYVPAPELYITSESRATMPVPAYRYAKRKREKAKLRKEEKVRCESQTGKQVGKIEICESNLLYPCQSSMMNRVAARLASDELKSPVMPGMVRKSSSDSRSSQMNNMEDTTNIEVAKALSWQADPDSVDRGNTEEFPKTRTAQTSSSRGSIPEYVLCDRASLMTLGNQARGGQMSVYDDDDDSDDDDNSEIDDGNDISERMNRVRFNLSNTKTGQGSSMRRKDSVQG